MAISEWRKQQQLERRDRVLECAKRLFLSKGFDATTMQDIADAAEVSKGSLYLEFRDKQDMIMALVLDSFNRLESLLATGASAEGNALERLEKISQAYIEFAVAGPGEVDHLWLLARLNPDPESQDRKVLRERIGRLGETVVKIFREGQRDGSLREELNADNLVSLFTIVMTDFIQRVSQLKQGRSAATGVEESLVREFLELFLYYITPVRR